MAVARVCLPMTQEEARQRAPIPLCWAALRLGGDVVAVDSAVTRQFIRNHPSHTLQIGVVRGCARGEGEGGAGGSRRAGASIHTL
jgi:hypothetical protein